MKINNVYIKEVPDVSINYSNQKVQVLPVLGEDCQNVELILNSCGMNHLRN